MTSTASTGAGSGRLRRWWVLAIALLLVAVACLAVGLRAREHPLAGPVGPQRPPPAAVKQTAFSPPPLAVAERSTPVLLSIPAIGLSVPLSQLGLNADGTVQVPTDFQMPGWFEPGPAPGQLGSAVILGHVDSYQGPAVFFQLRTLLTGDAVDVTLADGTVAHFAVYTVVQYQKTGFPTGLVYACPRLQRTAARDVRWGLRLADRPLPVEHRRVHGPRLDQRCRHPPRSLVAPRKRRWRPTDPRRGDAAARSALTARSWRRSSRRPCRRTPRPCAG